MNVAADGGEFNGRRSRRGRHVARVAMLVAWSAVVASVAMATPAPATAAATTPMSGVIRDESTGLPLAGVEVDIFDTDSARIDPPTSSTVTDPSGGYLLLVDSGCYRVEFTDPTGAYAQDTDERCVQGGYEDLLDVGLVPGGTASGRVTDSSSGSPLSGMCTWLTSTEGSYQTVSCTDGSGAYRSPGVPPGDYRVYVSDRSGRYLPRYYGDTELAGSASVVTIEAGTDRSSLDVGLPLVPPGARRVFGTVTSSDDGLPIPACVSLTNSFNQSWTGCTDTGEYYSPVLLTSAYLVSVSTPSATHFPKTHNAGKPFQVGLGVTDLDMELDRAGGIAGRLSASGGVPARDVRVEVCAAEDARECRFGVTDSTGGYFVGGLTTGGWTVAFGGDAVWPREFWHGRQDPETADLVAVTVGQTSAGIDGELDPIAGRLAGGVTANSTAQTDPRSGREGVSSRTSARIGNCDGR